VPADEAGSIPLRHLCRKAARRLPQLHAEQDQTAEASQALLSLSFTAAAREEERAQLGHRRRLARLQHLDQPPDCGARRAVPLPGQCKTHRAGGARPGHAAQLVRDQIEQLRQVQRECLRELLQRLRRRILLAALDLAPLDHREGRPLSQRLERQAALTPFTPDDNSFRVL
jgi:hypothetical protein